MLTLQTDSFTWSADASGYNLTLRTPQARRIACAVKKGKVYTVEIKEYKKQRTLNANALYWRCLYELAESLECSVPFAHNIMLRRYGQPERVNGDLVYVMLPDAEEAATKANEAETYHLRPTSMTKEKNGVITRAWVLLRGSHDYNTKEFSRLLDGVISECRECGIDVLTAREKELLYGNK